MNGPLAAPQRRLDLASWLGSLPPPSSDHLVLGGTGHLLLSVSEQARAAEHLLDHVMPTLLRHGSLRRVSLITGLAPGADILFKRFAADWLRAGGIEVDTIALLPVPVEVLLGDWVSKSSEESTPIASRDHDTMRARIERMLGDCDAIVDLLPPGAHPALLEDPLFRQTQYRRLAACLAEQSDVLVALLREQNLGQPGGTAEVVEWRRHPRRVPPELSTVGLRQPPAGGRRLIIIDPAVPAPEPSNGPA